MTHKWHKTTGIDLLYFVCFVYPCVSGTQPATGAITEFWPFFVCFVPFSFFGMEGE